MEEAPSLRERAQMLKRLQSPTSPFFLSSNNDQLERAQARAAARAAAVRRFVTVAPPPPPSEPCLSKDQITELFQNCIKLASENKINQKNTWELKLIDHLSEIIKVELGEGDAETNFQKASFTLEAGVKIYSFRVDTVHSEAYKVLGGIFRAGQEDGQETIVEGDNINDREGHSHNKKESEKKIISTLESSFESLNAKKFDVAFAVDPLYHQTSAQFDEGGAKGLLLNNLGVYEGCRVVFDSFEVPGKCKTGSFQNNNLDMIDFSFAKESGEMMVANMLEKNEICPTLKVIRYHFREDQRSSGTFDVGQKCDISFYTADAYEAALFDDSLGNDDAWNFDHDEVSSVVNEGSNVDPTSHHHHEENETYASYEPDPEDKFDDVAKFLFQGLGFTSRQNAWAGPNHWKYQSFKGSEEIPATNVKSTLTTKRAKRKNLKEDDVDFTTGLGTEMPDIFLPPKNPKLLLLPANRAPCDNTLPEDCHYQPESLVKLFLLPDIMCLGKRRRRRHLGFCDVENVSKNVENNHSSREQNIDFDEGLPSWDNESLLGSQVIDGHLDDVGNLDDLVSQPCQVNKVEVQYDKISKQVDVQTLKETLWDHMQGSLEGAEEAKKDALISFKHVLATFPFNCQAAAIEDISPHLCFICLLHLANEHGLKIQDLPSLDDLSIHLPASYQSTGVQT
ncbi:Condensin complex subunit 2/barren [Corchorus capsularis]|uniref:Condensin complex subunit 2 n=1 Tax=Corchorus capsularis TaxID=210143 RepID=A0A1R3ILS7_COCAP|nr:Condensin complex subunit 2/barren [Corchorus capsularis]